ncbi:N-acetylmuramoyl-L-alanine amidase [Phormidium sp. LEGE 05292]|uniref:N-acetylmuramoyl-L-alanine amidase n=1 Tax=[Phormidium] sp. LEGE 05292 TaxID=767427 RepID=UPI00187FC902|nr:N-acetylmuramoyl-L-alanine amidase [Phormidium sp. LEGE 05292]MBE9227445.1 N-acetylmuramoyl-L-alanine amidase [Phormidium sp. LEGE 05292]
MKFHWILPSTFLSLLLLSSPAIAAKLQSWRFDPQRNLLVFTTDGDVQPKAQLLFNPTRLVIDLPGTSLPRTINRQVGGLIRSVRIGQLDSQTTRLVIELVDGYTLDPQQVQFRGVSPRQWVVQLPTPTRTEGQQNVATEGQSSGTSLTLPTPEAPPPPPVTATAPVVPTITQIRYLQVTPDGLFLRTNGGNPEIKVDRSRERINIELEGAILSPQLLNREFSVNRNGVNTIQLNQVNNNPPVVRLTLKVGADSPDWGASVSSLGGIVLLPGAGQQTTAQRWGSQTANIQSIELSGNQLLIRSDRALTYTSGWDRLSGAYRITLNSSELVDRFQEPRLDRDAPISRLRIREDDGRVIILVLPASGIQVGEISQASPQLLALPFYSARAGQVPGSQYPPVSQGATDYPYQQLPTRRPNARALVVIDPGHGGKDPGAIGIGGLREVDVILPISLEVARLLEQQGVQVVLTRNSDYFVELSGRTAIANRVNADLFVSIHANSIQTRPDVSGLETYYFSSGLTLARYIHNSIIQSLNIPDRGVRRARFYVLRNSSMPSVLVETGFVTGYDDSARLATPAYQNQMAAAIARGILQYLQYYR